MFRTKKPIKPNKRTREEVSSLPSREESSSSETLDFLDTLSSPKIERDLSDSCTLNKDFCMSGSVKLCAKDSTTLKVSRKEPAHCSLEDEDLRETLCKLGNSLYYLASIIPHEESWVCHFVDTPPHKNNITRAKDKIISISATLTSVSDQFILLPFGDKPMPCGFTRQVEFTLTCDLGKSTVEAYHVCERGVHKLIFPEEVTIAGREHNLRNILPVHLEH